MYERVHLIHAPIQTYNFSRTQLTRKQVNTVSEYNLCEAHELYERRSEMRERSESLNECRKSEFNLAYLFLRVLCAYYERPYYH